MSGHHEVTRTAQAIDSMSLVLYQVGAGVRHGHRLVDAFFGDPLHPQLLLVLVLYILNHLDK